MVGGNDELTNLYCSLIGVSGSGKSHFVRIYLKTRILV